MVVSARQSSTRCDARLPHSQDHYWAVPLWSHELGGVERVLPVYMSPDHASVAVAYGVGSFVPFPSVDCSAGSLLLQLVASESNGDNDALCLLMRQLAGFVSRQIAS